MLMLKRTPLGARHGRPELMCLALNEEEMRRIQNLQKKGVRILQEKARTYHSSLLIGREEHFSLQLPGQEPDLFSHARLCRLFSISDTESHIE